MWKYLAHKLCDFPDIIAQKGAPPGVSNANRENTCITGQGMPVMGTRFIFGHDCSEAQLKEAVH